MGQTNVVKKKVFNFKKFMIFIIVIVLFVLFIINLLKKPIKNIIVLNNNLVSDEEILEISKLDNYPSFVKTSSYHTCKLIKKLDLIKECKVNKKVGYIIEIDVEEYKILYKSRGTNEYIIDNGKSITFDKDIEGIPLLINYVPDNIISKFNEELSLVNSSILSKISEIEYNPTTYDEGRFILYMNDSNMVYITLTKVDNLNKYNEIKKELEGKSGILYLDSGNYFEVKE